MSVRNYVFKDGQPYPLSKIYDINSPDNGFLSYYIYFKNKYNNVYPFVFNQEGVKNKESPYSRYNVAFYINGKVLILDRKYNSGHAGDVAPCLGFKGDVKVIHSRNQSVWFISRVYYGIANDEPAELDEVYYFYGNKLCFLDEVSTEFSSKKLSLSKLNQMIPTQDDFNECSE